MKYANKNNELIRQFSTAKQEKMATESQADLWDRLHPEKPAAREGEDYVNRSDEADA